jgi:hypothetical protein
MELPPNCFILYKKSIQQPLQPDNIEDTETLEAAYLAACAWCNDCEDPATENADMEIWQLQDGKPMASWTLDNAYAALQDEPLIPTASLGPWYIDFEAGLEDAFLIRDRDGNEVALVRNVPEVADHAHTNARLISKSVEILNLATDLATHLAEKEDAIRTTPETRFLQGLLEVFDQEEDNGMVTIIDRLDPNSRRCVEDMIDCNNKLYEQVNIWIKHGSNPTPEMITEMFDALQNAMFAQGDMEAFVL